MSVKQISVFIENKMIKGQVILTKVLASNATGLMEGEVGAKFGIYK